MTDDVPYEVLVERATYLASQDHRLKYDLVQARVDQGLSQQDVADRMGISLEDLQEFEAYWSDPSLARIRRYALCVNMKVTHVAERESDELS